MIFDRPIEVPFLIPIAVSMRCGVLFTIVVTLVLVSTALRLGEK